MSAIRSSVLRKRVAVFSMGWAAISPPRKSLSMQKCTACSLSFMSARAETDPGLTLSSFSRSSADAKESGFVPSLLRSYFRSSILSSLIVTRK